MTGRGRAIGAKSKQNTANPAQSTSCTQGRGKQSLQHDTKGRSESEQKITPSGDIGIVEMKTCSPVSGAPGSSSRGSPPPKSSGDVKPKKLKPESQKVESRPRRAETVKCKKTNSPGTNAAASSGSVSPQVRTRGNRNVKPEADRTNATSPLDRPSSHEKKKEKTCTKKYDKGASANKVLLSTLAKLKIKTTAKTEAASVINEIVDTVVKHMKQKSEYFRDVKKVSTGSYYENVKISDPDEFDVMLALPVDRVELHKFDSDGAFYSVALKRTPRDNPLRCFLNEDNTIAASRMLSEFRDHVKQAVDAFPDVQVERKKKGCPAVTLSIKQHDRLIGLDVVLSLEVHSSWPEFTHDGFGIESWLGTKHVVWFLCLADVWRISFSHVEKAILKNHGQAKTCCETEGNKCCRKPCLKLMKYLLQQLKQKHQNELSKFFSYLCKTTLLHACATRMHDSDWEMANLSHCFQQLLQDFEGYLRQGHLPNFFIPSHNLLSSGHDKKSCQLLANCIEYQRNNGFPIFEERLHCLSQNKMPNSPCSPGAAHAVHILLHVAREVIIEDMGDVMHIQTPRCQVVESARGGDDDVHPTGGYVDLGPAQAGNAKPMQKELTLPFHGLVLMAVFPQGHPVYGRQRGITGVLES
ncbi:hypothetical protein JZ751_027324 [Albula glossodonta]|uniref:Cyclic GMP-AMP synthase n=1 Tax=Albula glossodonta TaxID=121402 RepID=A0A8T2NNL9_9TELE|nr:hypothetical protein JZ751_027324 [Albula glossodonta]